MAEKTSMPSPHFVSNLRSMGKMLQLLHDKFREDIGHLEKEKLRKIPVTSYKTFTFIQKTLSKAADNQPTLPSVICLNSLESKSEALGNLQEIAFQVKQLNQDIEEFVQLMRFQLYAECKELYEVIQKPGQDSLSS